MLSTSLSGFSEVMSRITPLSFTLTNAGEIHLSFCKRESKRKTLMLILFPLQKILQFILKYFLYRVGSFSAIRFCFSCVFFSSQKVIHNILRLRSFYGLLYRILSLIFCDISHGFFYLLFLSLRSQLQFRIQECSSHTDIQRHFRRRIAYANQALELRTKFTSRHIHLQCIIDYSI